MIGYGSTGASPWGASPWGASTVGAGASQRRSTAPLSQALLLWLAVVGVGALPTAARADAGDLALGGYAVIHESPLRAGVGVLGDYGVGDGLALQGRLDATVAQGGFTGLLALDVAWSWDVVAWVPGFGVGLRAAVDPHRKLHAGAGGSIQLRRYLSFATYLLLGGEMVWFPNWEGGRPLFAGAIGIGHALSTW